MDIDTILKLTRPDGRPIWVVKSAIQTWTSAYDNSETTRVTLIDGYQIVLETPEEILETMMR
jgi:hypothetical protein